jgi:Flp pilus assembly protein TadG
MHRGIHYPKGQSLIEALISFIVMIPITLFAIDVICIFIASQNNEHAAQQAARAAANQRDNGGARDAAEKTISDNFQSSSVIESITLEDVSYDPDTTGNVSVTTCMAMNLPIPFPGIKNMTFRTTATAPIVAFPNPK